MKRIMRIFLFLSAFSLSASLLCADIMYSASIDTTPIAGSSGYMAFDLYGGTPLQDNTATISAFASTSTLGTSSPSGDVSGSLVPGPLTLKADQFFNEWLQAVTFGSGLTTFTLDVTTNYAPGTAPDSFAFFLLDSTQTPFATSDPTGADSLFAIDLVGGATSPAVYTSSSATATVTSPSAAVPEPAAVFLLAFVIFAAGVSFSRRGRQKAGER